MDELIVLINAYADYQKSHTAVTATEFCRHFMATMSTIQPPSGDPALARITPLSPDANFIRTISRLTAAYNLYLRIGLRATSLVNQERFNLLAATNRLSESRKTDIINYALIEISTGSEILNRLAEDGLISERVDPADKRSRLVRITEKGKEALQQGFHQSTLALQILLQNFPEEDKKLCIQLLHPLEERHSVIAVENRNKSLAEILAVVVP
ncbi:MarR family winged helix-turn-helix transcriptional regulator [Spirosoma fluminis]